MSVASPSRNDLLRAIDQLRAMVFALPDISGETRKPHWRETSKRDFTVGPGFVVRRGEIAIDITPKDTLIMSALEHGASEISNIMHRGQGAVWREQYTPAKREKIVTQIRRLNDRLLRAGMEIRLQGETLSVGTFTPPSFHTRTPTKFDQRTDTAVGLQKVK